MKEKTVEVTVKFEVKLYENTESDIIDLEPAICNPQHFYFRDRDGNIIAAKSVKETQLVMKEI